MRLDSRIYVAGHRGMVGRALCRRLHAAGYTDVRVRTHRELDLRDGTAVQRFFTKEKPAYVFIAAAKVGGIHANNTKRSGFIYDNLMIASNLVHASYVHGVKKLLFLGSSCIYPRAAVQPMREEALLTGPLEQTNEPYAVAKIAGIKLCEAYRDEHACNFISAMPTNLYGPYDNFDKESSHVLPALLGKIHEAQVRGISEVEIWGTGAPRREFMHVDDLARACLLLMEKFDAKAFAMPSFVNVGCGKEICIADLATLIARVVGYGGRFVFDSAKPDGTPRKLLDITRLARLGFTPSISLEAGIRSTYAWYRKKHAHAAP